MMSANVTCVPPVICMHTRAITTHISMNITGPPTPFHSPEMANILLHLNFAICSSTVWDACPLSLIHPSQCYFPHWALAVHSDVTQCVYKRLYCNSDMDWNNSMWAKCFYFKVPKLETKKRWMLYTCDLYCDILKIKDNLINCLGRYMC